MEQTNQMELEECHRKMESVPIKMALKKASEDHRADLPFLLSLVSWHPQHDQTSGLGGLKSFNFNFI